MKRLSRNAELDEFLEKELADAGYGGEELQKTPVGTRITLFVTRPGLVIGRGGMGIKALTEKVEKKFGFPSPQISVVEIESPELNPRIMASRIAHIVARGTAFRRAAMWTLNTIMGAGAMGCEIAIAGKLRGERAHFEKFRAGVVPKSGAPVERVVRHATTDVLLKTGLYGIKVKIALRDAMPPDVELIEAPEGKAEQASAPQEVAANVEAQTQGA